MNERTATTEHLVTGDDTAIVLGSGDLAASSVGATVTATATVVHSDGRLLRFQVAAHDDSGQRSAPARYVASSSTVRGSWPA